MIGAPAAGFGECGYHGTSASTTRHGVGLTERGFGGAGGVVAEMQIVPVREVRE
jgi:hypothetical protein